MKKRKTILITGIAGFIGYHTAKQLLERDYKVIGVDNLNTYYDVDLKYARLVELGIAKTDTEFYGREVSSSRYDHLSFYQLKLEDRANLPKLFQNHRIEIVCNLAAQAGVRYSIENPEVYIDTNITGFLNVLQCMREFQVSKIVYASSSSVYGNSDEVPFKEDQSVDHPISVYAATKKTNELLAHTYSHLFGIQSIGLRFFTVYGPWGRPDMAMHLFSEAITKNKPIKVFNNGDLSRDFTYIDDIVEGVIATIEKDLPHQKKYGIYNIGNSKPVQLLEFIKALELAFGKKAIKEMYPMQDGDVNQTWADVSELQKDFGYAPSTYIQTGIDRFVEWYKEYYGLV
ncbi:NAD-dependent epimerase/dehydratase family protein [Psychroflexus gondwanensis]|uniref:NAD-dependent epimerase/dehydratase family protein n=1 Tax=Psychroflexus gondwanensis TaxID=251 RepID=UPI0011BE69A2|nr:NAD-dependent epimerase/dehydratase family protein [Psychroflexus gondwanensis]TXE21542.1 NAD-dependent epimerase/dehydratase family protein [Psychroflexus gondwanensis]